MKQNLTLGSLFDGSGGFPLGGLMAGITPVWSSELEPFPIRVTTKRLPFMEHYGDIRQIDGGEIPPVDIITGGFPCQDVSIAGKRAGLEGKRTGLFYEAVRIIKEMREKTNGQYPRYFVAENVPGLYSSNDGEDFRTVLEEIIKIADPEAPPLPAPEKGGWPGADVFLGDGWSVAYRTLDAQYWGVPQRRRRMFLVADFAGGRAGKILFESEGLSGYSAAGIRAWQGAAGGAAPCAGESGYVVCLNDQGGERMDVTTDITCTLRAEAHHPPVALIENYPMDGRSKLSEDGKVQTLTSRMGTGGNNVPLVMGADTPKTLKVRSGCEGGGKGALIQDNKSATLGCNNDQTLFVPQAYGISSFTSNAMLSDNPKAGIYEADTSRTLDVGGGNPTCNQGGIAVVESYAIQGNMIGRDDSNGPQGKGINKEVSFTLNATDHHAVYAMTTGVFMQTLEDQAPTICARDYKNPASVAFGIGGEGKPSITEEVQPSLAAQGPGNAASYTVRRLTPTECARLQGFPDWWCAGLETENPTDEEISFWEQVFEDYRRLTNPNGKPKTTKQIIKWLQAPHSDSAEYKMWGNGVSLPVVFFVLSGIVWSTHSEG